MADSGQATFRAESEEADFRGDVILTPNGSALLNIDTARAAGRCLQYLEEPAVRVADR